MKWDKYQTRFTEKAKEKKLNNIDYFLEYAQNLYIKNLPIIFNTNHFSHLVGYNTNYLQRAIKHTPYFYRDFFIPKKNGSKRLISEPLPSLKEIQKWILNEILYKCKVSTYAKAYVRNRTLKSNALFHKNKEAVLTIDIVDFFKSINNSNVYDLFYKMGYNEEVCTLLSKMCTLKESLPQGAPTSPYISNLIFKEIDEKIGYFCKKKDINYTRYSDDLTFSGDKNIGWIIPHIESFLEEGNFIINKGKLRIRRESESQQVTGITVNKKLQAPLKTRKDFRQAIFYIKKYGLEDHLQKIGNSRRNYLEHLIGIGNFICFINPNDNENKNNLQYLKELKKHTARN